MVRHSQLLFSWAAPLILPASASFVVSLPSSEVAAGCVTFWVRKKAAANTHDGDDTSGVRLLRHARIHRRRWCQTWGLFPFGSGSSGQTPSDTEQNKWAETDSESRSASFAVRTRLMQQIKQLAVTCSPTDCCSFWIQRSLTYDVRIQNKTFFTCTELSNFPKISEEEEEEEAATCDEVN